MQCRRLAPRPALVLALLWSGVTSCGAEAPPPPVRSGGSLRAAGPARGNRVPSGGSTASLGDSALEPAAAQAASSEDWPQAETLYKELVRRQPRSATARRGLGVALMHQQKYDLAITALEDSVRLGDSAATRLELAATFAALGRHPSALPHLRKAVLLAPAEPAGWTALVDALVKVEKPEGAADALRESRKACPACPKDPAWNKVTDEVATASIAKAEKQIASGDASGARKSADLAVTLRPNLPEGHMALGKVARTEGDTKAAASAFRKAVQHAPDAAAEPGAGARLELATLLMGDGQGDEAVKLAEQVVAARADDGAALDTLGRACEATRNTDCARRAYAKLATLPASDGKAKDAVEHAKVRMKALKPGRKGKK